MDEGDDAAVDAAPGSPSTRPASMPIDLTAAVAVALVSPDSQNNNCAHPIRPRSGSFHKLGDRPPASDEKAPASVSQSPSPTDGSTEFDGEILFGDEGRCIYIVDAGASLSRPDLQETTSNADLRRAVYIQPGTVNHFSVVSGTEVDEPQLPTDPIAVLLICISCKLTFSSADSFCCHLDNDHYARPSPHELELLCAERGMSAIAQADQRLRFLLPLKDPDASSTIAEENVLTERPGDTVDQVSTEELTRNLILAQELSATRLLQQVSQNAMAMASMSSHSLGQASCPLHSDGKPYGLDCASCELAMAAQQSSLPASLGGGAMGMMASHPSLSTARNSCKTLKCPKCNWHYKYQETLEIHMKEKHSDSEVTCVYCMQNRAHPKLARGETYGCGYKPYRCDICKYSTTTKGNLSIHMQSDKHLNNMHELQQGNKLLDPNDLIHADPPPPRTPTPKGTGPLPFRCDVCQYETNIARNLRIHMTSEKHGHNMRRSRSQPIPGSSCGDAFVSPSADTSSPATGLQFPPLPDLTTFQIFQCCVCAVFGTQSADELLAHVELERNQPVDGDTMVMAGNFVCNLCQYRTNLKANFQLHTKTDKHVQRLQLVNHVREGGATNEWRMRFANVNSPVQLRCNACNEFFTCWNKLQAHSVAPQHLCSVKAYELIAGEIRPDHMIACKLCAFETVERSSALAHLQSLQHGQNVSRWMSCDGPTDEIFVTRRCADNCSDAAQRAVTAHEGDDGDARQGLEDEWRLDDDALDMTDAIHCCAWCNYTCKTTMELCDHVQQLHTDIVRQSTTVAPLAKGEDDGGLQCPLCQSKCGSDRGQLESHLLQVHNVPEEGIRRLLVLLPSSSRSPSPTTGVTGSPPASVPADSTTSNHADSDEADRDSSPSDLQIGEQAFSCPSCALPFPTSEDLCAHQSESGHLKQKTTPTGSVYYCWQPECKLSFSTTQAVHMHFRDTHSKRSPPSGCVSDRHVYRFRCNQCSLAFRTEEKLQHHSLYHLMRASMRCVLCERNFRSKDTLLKHVETEHGGSERALSGEPHMAAGNGDNEDEDDEDEADLSVNGQRTLQRRNEMNGSGSSRGVNLDKYLDPSRPFKCETCKESFTQKNILVVHYNSVSHLHKTKKLLEKQPNSLNLSPEVLAALGQPQIGNPASSSTTAPTKAHAIGGGSHPPSSAASSSRSSDKPYRCNICKQSYGQGSTLDIHLRSVAHQSKFSKLAELIASGQVDPTKPYIEQPAGAATQSSAKQLISEMLSSKKQSQQQQQQQQHELDALEMLKMQQQVLATSGSDPQSAIAMMNMLNMAQLFPLFAQAMQQQQQSVAAPSMSSCDRCQAAFATEEALHAHQMTACAGHKQQQQHAYKGFTNGNSIDDEERALAARYAGGFGAATSRSGSAFRKQLENYGFEVVMQFNETGQQRKRRPEEKEGADGGAIAKKRKFDANAPPEMSRSMCTECGKEFSSVWVLKAHSEQVHRSSIPLEAIENISDRVRQVYERKRQPQTATVKEEVRTPHSERPASAASSSVVSANEPPPAPPSVSTAPTAPTPTKISSNTLSAAKKSSAKKEQQEMQKNVNEHLANAMMQQGMMGMMQQGFPGFPFMSPGFPSPFAPFSNPFMPMMPSSMTGSGDPTFDFMAKMASGGASSMPSMSSFANHSAMMAQQQQSPAKRARTRINDSQLKVLREYFDINNSPTEEQIKEMSRKADLPEKVIKHWFRNTLFKERQRDKDSPYNFNIPPQIGIDLDAYEKTGEARIITINNEKPTTSEDGSAGVSGQQSPAASTSATIQIKEELREEPRPVEERKVKQRAESPATLPTASDMNTLASALPFSSVMNDAAALMSQAHAAQEALQRLQSVSGHMPMMQNSLASGVNPFSMLLNVATGNSPSATNDMKTGVNSTEAMTNLIAGSMMPSSSSSSSSTPGRRANRTRFTDYQLKTLQEFFDRQAYPKDDDLEKLSNKMGLSPRVIVVWFQNARQKARKIYENQPHAENHDRFVKTPGCNFQCKRCSLVFQRYYELIQHQQKQCYKDDGAAQQSDNVKCGVDQMAEMDDKSDEYDSSIRCDKCDISFNEQTQLDEHLKGHHTDSSLFFGDKSKRTLSQLLPEVSTTPGSSSSPSPDLHRAKRSRDSTPVVRLQNPRVRDRRKEFNKRCPFCGILFYSKDSMQAHLPLRHPDQCHKTIVNIDLLPDAEEVPTITTATVPQTLMDEAAAKGYGDLAQSMMKMGMFPGANDSPMNPMDVLKRITESAGSPLDLSGGQQLKVHTSNSNHSAPASNLNGGGGGGGPPTDGSGGSMSMSGSPHTSYAQSDGEDTGRMSSFSQYDSASPATHMAGQQPNAIIIGGPSMHGRFRAGSKRYRTHLTPMQVQVMKSLFREYKTPSMAECDLLGAEIGLHKRVVQVWFQNARAKERKAKAVTGQDSRPDLPHNPPPRCSVCNLDYTPKLTLQDHIFTADHIARVQDRLRAQGTEDTPATVSLGVAASVEDDSRSPRTKPATKPVRDTGSRKADVSAEQPPAAMAFANAMNPAAFGQFPYNMNMMYGMSGMPMMYDPNIMGTPIQMLQIPQTVMQQISTDMASRMSNSTKFTQDGKSFSELAAVVSARDFQCAGGKDCEVGWACRQCTTVFQQESMLHNHHRMVCRSTGPNAVFKLVQTHYECRACGNVKVGTQAEYKAHCSSAEHQKARERFLG